MTAKEKICEVLDLSSKELDVLKGFAFHRVKSGQALSLESLISYWLRSSHYRLEDLHNALNGLIQKDMIEEQDGRSFFFMTETGFDYLPQ